MRWLLLSGILGFAALGGCRGERTQCEPCDVDRDCSEGVQCTHTGSTQKVCLQKCGPDNDACEGNLECNAAGRCVPVLGAAPDPEITDFGCASWLGANE